jgi:hypothetical protein
MQSSAAVTFRALVMLTCLVVIPLVAVFGISPLQDAVKKALDGPWAARLGLSKNNAAAPPAFEPIATAGSTLSVAPKQLPTGVEANAILSVPARPIVALGDPSAGVIPAGYDAPGDSARPLAPAAQASPTIEPFTAIQNRLRQLGATYYLLESWGTQQQLYRFHCRIAVGGNPDYTHYFEATGVDPLATMAQVVQQVESRRGALP